MPSEETMADGYSVPEYFITDLRVEDAGGGCVRVFNCVRRCGELIPMCSVVIPLTVFMVNNATLRATALEIMRTVELIH